MKRLFFTFLLSCIRMHSMHLIQGPNIDEVGIALKLGMHPCITLIKRKLNTEFTYQFDQLKETLAKVSSSKVLPIILTPERLKYNPDNFLNLAIEQWYNLLIRSNPKAIINIQLEKPTQNSVIINVKIKDMNQLLICKIEIENLKNFHQKFDLLPKGQIVPAMLKYFETYHQIHLVK